MSYNETLRQAIDKDDARSALTILQRGGWLLNQYCVTKFLHFPNGGLFTIFLDCMYPFYSSFPFYRPYHLFHFFSVALIV